jgi:hypothetical protein
MLAYPTALKLDFNLSPLTRVLKRPAEVVERPTVSVLGIGTITISNDHLLGVGTDHQIGVVTDHNDLTFTLPRNQVVNQLGCD